MARRNHSEDQDAATVPFDSTPRGWEGFLEMGTTAPSADPQVPDEVFEPLLKIARLGYDANNLKAYYLMVLGYSHFMSDRVGEEEPRTQTTSPRETDTRPTTVTESKPVIETILIKSESPEPAVIKSETPPPGIETVLIKSESPEQSAIKLETSPTLQSESAVSHSPAPSEHDAITSTQRGWSPDNGLVEGSRGRKRRRLSDSESGSAYTPSELDQDETRNKSVEPTPVQSPEPTANSTRDKTSSLSPPPESPEPAEAAEPDTSVQPTAQVTGEVRRRGYKLISERRGSAHALTRRDHLFTQRPPCVEASQWAAKGYSKKRLVSHYHNIMHTPLGVDAAQSCGLCQRTGTTCKFYRNPQLGLKCGKCWKDAKKCIGGRA